MHGQPMRRNVVFGTITSVNGSTLSVTPTQSVGSTSAPTLFTVDASSARIFGGVGNATTTVGSLSVGNTVMIEGVINGTNVTANVVRINNVPPKPKQGDALKSILKTSGQPVVLGKVTLISGSIITISNQGGLTYTVDATNAKIFKGKDTMASVSGIATGDSVLVQGAVNGTNVIASTILDQGPARMDNKNQASTAGFFGSIKGFFSRIFGR